MPKIASKPLFLGNYLIREEMPEVGYCRKLATVTVPAGGLKVGSMLKLAAGKYTIISAADVASLTVAQAGDIAMLTDADAPNNTTAGDYTMTVLFRGPAVISDQVIYGDTLTGAQKTTVQTKAEVIGITTRAAI